MSTITALPTQSMGTATQPLTLDKNQWTDMASIFDMVKRKQQSEKVVMSITCDLMAHL